MEILIYSTDNTISALQIKEIFEQNNIKCFMKNFYTQNVNDSHLFTGTNLLLGQIEIYINDSDKKFALNLIKMITKKTKKYKLKKIEIEKYNTTVAYKEMMAKSFLLSFCSVFLSPLPFNAIYLIKIIRYRLWVGLFLLALSIMTTFCGILMLIHDVDDFMFLNTIVIPVLCIAKFNSLNKRIEIKYHYLFLIPAVIGIIIFLIKLF
jgi:hypothetical protein